MRSSLRASLAVSAVVASSIAAALSGAAGAQAAPAGPAASPLTISDGTASVSVNGRSVHFSGAVTDAAWAPDGSRLAYIDGDGQLAVADAAGGDVRVLTSGAGARSHPTWEDGGSEIVFAQVVNGASELLSVDANGLTMGKPTVAEPVEEAQRVAGANSAPDAAFTQWDPAHPDAPAVNKLVYQHADPSGPQVWILDRNTRGPAGVKVTEGSSPSVAPDGHAVAFVDAAGQIETVALPVPFDAQGHPQPVLTKVTTGGTAYSHLTWSADSTTIAAEGMSPGATRDQDQAKDVETVAADGKSAPVVVRSTPGVPSYQPLVMDTVNRVDGSDRLGTAIAASKATWSSARPDGSSAASGVVLSRADEFADALGGSALANHVGGPLLLTDTAGLNPAVKAEIQRVLGKPSPAQFTTKKTVYLLGGEQALSPAVADQVKALGYEVKRLGGSDRFATSVAVADAVTTVNGVAATPARIFVATGRNFADALSAGAAASQFVPDGVQGDHSAVVVLTDDKAMPAATAAYVNRAAHTGAVGSSTVIAVGGQADAALRSIGYHVGSGAKQFTPVWGADRYATSLLVAQDFFDGPSRVGFATGLNWADALSGGALAGHLNAPLLLTDPKTGPTGDVLSWLRHSAPQLDRVLVFGGKVAVGGSVDSVVGTAISGPAGYATAENPTGLY
ncbi:cell wall-binding repeat-containing protein [Catenulispora subtropica]|uniref:Cell wall binding repeat 2-containing protein n=1 Tax=Catenulispora subtropica TaxID=450798 RepID=A0ABN2QTW0_9ACTN